MKEITSFFTKKKVFRTSFIKKFLSIIRQKEITSIHKEE